MSVAFRVAVGCLLETKDHDSLVLRSVAISFSILVLDWLGPLLTARQCVWWQLLFSYWELVY